MVSKVRALNRNNREKRREEIGWPKREKSVCNLKLSNVCAESIVTNSIRVTRLIDVIDFSLPFTIVVFAHRYTKCWVGAKWNGRRNQGKEKEQRNFFSSLCWIARKCIIRESQTKSNDEWGQATANQSPECRDTAEKQNHYTELFCSLTIKKREE